MDKKKLLKYSSPTGFAIVKASERANTPERQETKLGRQNTKEAAKAEKATVRQERRDAARQSFQEQKTLKNDAYALTKVDGGKIQAGKVRIAITEAEVVLLGGLRGNTKVPLNGAVARLETTHQITQRVSVGAELTLGILASRQKTHNLSYLTIEHPLGHGIHVEVYKRDVDRARQIAVAVNQAAQALTPPGLLAPATNQADTADQLAKLADLHAHGALSAEEFAAAKARVLDQP